MDTIHQNQQAQAGAEEASSAATSEKEIKRGPKFRKELLVRIIGINYKSPINPKQVDLDAWLGIINEIKADAFLKMLQQVKTPKSSDTL